MKREVNLFAAAKEALGTAQVAVDLPANACVADLRTAMAHQFPALKPMADSLLIALGTEYADNSTPLDSSTEIACFPPVSGG
jgi:molybdopterin synthase sulfur carrier subunit